MPKDKRNGNITEYQVTVENRIGHIVQNVSVGGNGNTVLIGGLEMFVTYSFKVRAFTKVGAGPYSGSVSETTEQSGMATTTVVTLAVFMLAKVEVVQHI